jgi:hypothetical protein
LAWNTRRLLQSEPYASITAAPAAEWTYHRTADGQHPNGDEQALVWLMNRARSNPAAEGQWLATESNADVASGRVFFQGQHYLIAKRVRQLRR